MLTHPVLITGESQVKFIIWLKYGHIAYLLATIYWLEAKPVYEIL